VILSIAPFPFTFHVAVGSDTPGSPMFFLSQPIQGVSALPAGFPQFLLGQLCVLTCSEHVRMMPRDSFCRPRNPNPLLALRILSPSCPPPCGLILPAAFLNFHHHASKRLCCSGHLFSYHAVLLTPMILSPSFPQIRKDTNPSATFFPAYYSSPLWCKKKTISFCVAHHSPVLCFVQVRTKVL